MKTYQIDSVFFGVLTGVIASGMLIGSVAVAQSALQTPTGDIESIAAKRGKVIVGEIRRVDTSPELQTKG